MRPPVAVPVVGTSGDLHRRTGTDTGAYAGSALRARTCWSASRRGVLASRPPEAGAQVQILPGALGIKGRHKVIYRGPYIKGPDVKPFVDGDTVRGLVR